MMKLGFKEDIEKVNPKVLKLDHESRQVKC